MPEGAGSWLRRLSDEIAGLAGEAVKSTAIVTGETPDFGEISGSAWLYDAATLVTNNHVVEQLVEPIWVRFGDSPEIRAAIGGRDPQTDLAILLIERQAAQPLQLSTTPPRLGELCFALGSPLGDYPETMTIGVVSGLNRRLANETGRVLYGMIQTDCAINHGNSGGPLIDVDGVVLGVNSSGYDHAHSMGFAIPAVTVSQIVPELMTYGVIARASLGIHVAFTRLGDGTGISRLVVTGVRPTLAGPLETGDVLLAIGPHQLGGPRELLSALGRDVLDQSVPVTILRHGQQLSVECVPRAAAADSEPN